MDTSYTTPEKDSDVLVYSAACGMPFPIIYKLDRKTGNCNVFSMDWVSLHSQFLIINLWVDVTLI